jgi:5-methylcytosine-specific restriction enzyme subunit McrC
VYTLELFEWERGVHKSPFSESELRILKKFNDSVQRSEKSDALTVTYGKIYTYSFVGIIQIGKKRIEILPKLFNPKLIDPIIPLEEREKQDLKRSARKNLFSLLSIAGLIPFYKSGISRYGKEQDFFEFLIALFLTDLEMIMSSHFYHEYVHKSDDIGHIKGKLNFQHQIVKLPSQLHTFSCIFDEFSIDNPLNRIIKATLKKIQEVCKNEENKKRAFNFYSLMHGIEDEVIIPSSIARLHFDRLNEKYEGIVEFCCMILFGSTYSASEGPHHYYALIFDMNLVFERYVTKLLRNAIQEFNFDYQNDLYLASEYRPIFQYIRSKKRMIPDIIVRDEEKSIAIIDTKYKPDLSSGFISNSDTYQMLAYSIANESDKAILLYPQLPSQDTLKERDHFVVLDKLERERKKERAILISARSVKLFDDKGKILRRMTEGDANTIRKLLNSQAIPEEAIAI